MKKLMVAFAAVALAAGAQAAAVSWGSGSFVDHNGATVAKGSSGYTATIHFFAYNIESGEYDINADATFGGTLSTTEVAKGPTMKGDTNTSGITTGNYMAQLTIVNGDWTLESEKALFAYDADSLSANLSSLHPALVSLSPVRSSTSPVRTTAGRAFRSRRAGFCSSSALRALPSVAAARNLRQSDQLKVDCFKKPLLMGRLFDIIQGERR